MAGPGHRRRGRSLPLCLAALRRQVVHSYRLDWLHSLRRRAGAALAWPLAYTRQAPGGADAGLDLRRWLVVVRGVQSPTAELVLRGYARAPSRAGLGLSVVLRHDYARDVRDGRRAGGAGVPTGPEDKASHFFTDSAGGDVHSGVGLCDHSAAVACPRCPLHLWPRLGRVYLPAGADQHATGRRVTARRVGAW